MKFLKIGFSAIVAMGFMTASAQSSNYGFNAIDSSFGVNGVSIGTGGSIYAGMAVQTDNKILIAGSNANSGFVVSRFKVDGGLDSTFGTYGATSSLFGGTQ